MSVPWNCLLFSLTNLVSVSQTGKLCAARGRIKGDETTFARGQPRAFSLLGSDACEHGARVFQRSKRRQRETGKELSDTPNKGVSTLFGGWFLAEKTAEHGNCASSVSSLLYKRWDSTLYSLALSRESLYKSSVRDPWVTKECVAEKSNAKAKNP